MTLATADLSDQHPDDIQIAEPGFRDYGGVPAFAGMISTVRCLNDNSKVREALEEEGNQRVLVVDGSASMRCALLGDILAAPRARAALGRGHRQRLHPRLRGHRHDSDRGQGLGHESLEKREAGHWGTACHGSLRWHRLHPWTLGLRRFGWHSGGSPSAFLIAESLSRSGLRITAPPTTASQSNQVQRRPGQRITTK